MPTDTRTSDPDLVAEVVRIDRELHGFVLDPTDFGRQFVVELVIDGWPHRIARAMNFEPIEGDQGCGFRHGFVFTLPNHPVGTIEVRLANSLRAIATLSGPSSSYDYRAGTRRSSGTVIWEGGLRVTGWLVEHGSVRGICGEALAFEVAADTPRLVATTDGRKVRFAFDAYLPARFADGRVHRIEVVDSKGQALQGSPVSIVAWNDGLAETLEAAVEAPGELLRGELFDALMPRSIPFAWVERWRRGLPAESAEAPTARIAVVLFGDIDIEATLATLESSTARWVLAALPVQSSQDLTFDPNDLQAFADGEASECDAFVFCLSGTRLDPNALSALTAPLREGASASYGDVVLRDDHGRVHPLAFSGFDLDRALDQGYGVHLFALSGGLVRRVSGDRPADPFRLFAAAFTGEPPRHAAGFLAHSPPFPRPWSDAALGAASVAYCQARGARASLEPARSYLHAAVRLRRDFAAERVSVLVAVRDRPDDLAATLDNLRTMRSRHRVELILVDCGSGDAATRRILSQLRGDGETLVSFDETDNRARAFNAAAAKARTRHVVFLSAGSFFTNGDDLDEVLERCQHQAVAAAGPSLVSARGFIRAAGLVLGPRFSVAPAFAGLALEDPGYGDLLCVARTIGALPIDGLTVKRRDFVTVGGFDERQFGRCFFAVDFAQKLKARGRRLVLSPHSRLTIPDWVSTEFPPFVAVDTPAQRELDLLRNLYGDGLLDDEFYSPLLSLAGQPYSGLAFQPRTRPPSNASPPAQ